jgi:hypothetical protein
MAVMLAGAACTVTATAAAQASWQNSAADFSRICVSSLLAPDELAAALKERGMSATSSAFAPPGWDGALYSATDGGRGVTVAYQHYSDLKISNCTTIAPGPTSRQELDGLRATLEAHPRIGKLEGRVMDASPTSRLAMFKRPGNAPMVTFNFTSVGTATTLSMTRYDLKPGN